MCLCWGLLWHVQSCLSDKRIEGHSWFWQSLISLASDSHVDCSISITAGHDFLRMGMFLYCLSIYLSIYLSVCLSVCRYISKNLKIMKKVNICCHSFQKVKPIYYIDSLHIEGNISSLYFLKFWWLRLTDNENPKFSVSEYNIRSIKKDILNKNVRLLKVYSFLCTQYLVGPPFAWITAFSTISSHRRARRS